MYMITGVEMWGRITEPRPGFEWGIVWGFPRKEEQVGGPGRGEPTPHGVWGACVAGA